MQSSQITELKIGPTTVSMPQEVGGCLKASVQALQAGDAAGAIERIAATAVLDIQQYQETFLRGAAEAAILCDLYEAAFGLAGLRNETIGVRDHDGPLRVAYVISSVLQGQGPARRLTDMVERHDRELIAPSVFVTDELSQREPALSFFQGTELVSATGGRAYLERMRGAGVEPVLAPLNGTLLEGGLWLTRALRESRADLVVFIASVASPMQAVAAFCGVAPVQVNQNVAVPLPLKQMDGMIYHNASCAKHDAPVLSLRGIEACVVASVGTDLEAARSAVGIDRAVLGVPADVRLLVTASNKLEARALHGTFGEDLARFLRRDGGAWWMGIGRGDMRELRALLEREGVGERVVFVGAVDDVRPYFKAADIYLNEYPEGGGNTNIEAMACGLAVAAVRAGARHTESIGAELVGEAQAAESIEGYWNRVAAWCGSEAERRRAVAELGRRVERQYSIDATCRAYEAHYLRLAGRGAETTAA